MFLEGSKFIFQHTGVYNENKERQSFFIFIYEVFNDCIFSLEFRKNMSRINKVLMHGRKTISRWAIWTVIFKRWIVDRSMRGCYPLTLLTKQRTRLNFCYWFFPEHKGSIKHGYRENVFVCFYSRNRKVIPHKSHSFFLFYLCKIHFVYY